MGHPTVVFDTHLYIKKLKTTGVSEAQAEVHAETLATLFEDRLTTKSDLEDLKNHVDHQFACIETRFIGIEARLTAVENRLIALENRLAALEAKFIDLETKFAGLKIDIIKWFLSISFTQAALIVSLIKFLH